MTGSVLLDISQLLRDPCWTGIQRVERQLIRHWPGPAPLVPVRYDPRRGALERLPDAILDLLCRPRACEDAAQIQDANSG